MRTVVFILFLLGGSEAFAQQSEDLRDCPFHEGQSAANCPICARERSSRHEDEECREAKAHILRHSKLYSAKEVGEMSCTRAKIVASIYGWKSYEERQQEAKRKAEEAARKAKREAEEAARKAKREAEEAARKAKREADDAARKAKEQGDRQAAQQIDQQTQDLGRQSMGFNPYAATGDPAVLREQAKQARDSAKQLRDQALKAMSAGSYQQQHAFNRQAQELDNRAINLETAARSAESRRQSEDFQSRLQRQTGEAVRRGLEDTASGVADEYGSVVRDGLEEAMDLPAVPGRYTGERVREYLESATDRAGTVVPLADTAADYIAGPMRREINRHLDSSRNLPPSRGGGGYSGFSPPSASRSWSDTPSAEPAASDYEQTVDDAFEELREIARQKQAEQQKFNELLNILKPPASATKPTSPSPYDRITGAPATITPAASPYDRVKPKPAPPPLASPYDRPNRDLRQ